MAFYQLTYIYHDCFVLETASAVILFDYWKDPISGQHKDFPPLLDFFKKDKEAWILVSHHHKDHFSRRIFLWQERIPQLKYVISSDVFKAVRYLFNPGSTYKGFKPSEGSVIVLNPGESFETDNLAVKAYPSTDMGNSYIVRLDGLNVFHAGDLNAWIWVDESSEDEVRTEKNRFTRIIDEIREENPSLDLAMFPVDSRLGTDYWWGAEYFVKNIKTSMFVPMHFELVTDEKDKTQRKLDAGKFEIYANKEYGEYVQLSGSRSCMYINR